MELRGRLSKFNFLKLLVLASGFVFTSFASAQIVVPLPATDVIDTSIDEIGFRKTTQPLDEIKADQLKIEERGSLSQGLNTIPGIQARTEGSPLISIHGAQSSARTLVLQDGVPLNFSDGVGFNPLLVATENLAQVSLLRGPGSAYFGHDALSGALEFKSLQLDKPKFFVASSGHVSNFAQTLGPQRLYAGAPFGTPFSRFQATVYETHQDGRFPYTHQGQNFLRDRNDQELMRATLSGKVDAGDLKLTTYNLFARQLGSIPGSLDFPFAQSLRNWGGVASLGADYDFGSQITGRAKGSYKVIDQTYNDTPQGRTTSLRSSLSLTKTWRLVRLELFGDFTQENLQATYLPSGAQNVLLSEFGVHSQIVITRDWFFQAAARASSEGSKVTPTFGLAGQLANKWVVFTNYSEGYRVASVTQKFAQFTGYQGNPGLSPETSTETNVGLEKREDDYDVTFLAFTRNFNNLIDNRVVSAGVLSPFNVGQSRANGFETRGNLKLYDEIVHRLGGAIAFLDHRQIYPDGPMALSPQFQLSFSAQRSFGPWSLTLQDTYWSSFYDRNVNTGGLDTVAAWNSTDLFATYDFSSRIKMKFSVTNLFDQSHELTLGYPEPQRQFECILEAAL